MQVSEKQYEPEILAPLSIEELKRIIIERKSVKQCKCWNSLYETGDSDCLTCSGTGYVDNRLGRVSRACLQSAGQLVDEGDPLVYACTFDKEIKVDDVIVCEGVRYVVIEISAGFTTDNKDVLICGLNYERNYDYNQTELERYR